MRHARFQTALLVLLIGLLAGPTARCDEDDWTEGTPNLQLWDQLNTAQTEIMQSFIDFSREFAGVPLYYNARWRKMEFNASGIRPVPALLQDVLRGAAEVSVRAYVRKFTGEVKRYGKPSPGDVNGHPTALWSIDPKSRWIIWQRDGLTLRMRASARDKAGKQLLSAPDGALAVARLLDRYIDTQVKRKGSVVILFDASATMAGKDLRQRLNSVIQIARSGARYNRSMGPTTLEWALLTFSGDEIRVQHPFTQDADLTGNYCGMIKAGGDSTRTSLAQAVAYALGYLHANARGSTGKVAIISNGLGAAKGKDSIKRLNNVVGKLRLTNQVGAPAAQYDQAPESRSPGGGGAPLEDTFARLESAAAASGRPGRIDILGLDPGSEDEATLRSITDAAGGRFLPGRTEAQRNAAAAHLATPGPTASVAADPQGGGGGEQPPDTTGRVIICRDVLNGEAVDPMDAFDQTDSVCALWQYPDLVPGSNSTAVWTRDGIEYARSDQILDGSGTIAYWVRNSAPGGHPAGAYRLDIGMGGRTVASKRFTIGTAPGELIAGETISGSGRIRPPSGEEIDDPDAVTRFEQDLDDEDLNDPDFGHDDDVDMIIYSKDGAEIIEMGELTAFNGNYYTLTTGYGMPRRVMAQDVISLLLNGIGEGVPPDANAGSIVLGDGKIIKGEITHFDGSEFTIKKPDGTKTKLARSQVRAVAVRSEGGGR